jgi:hypothetical protein
VNSPALILCIWPCLARHPKKVVHPQLFSVAPLAHCHYVAVRDADNEVLTLQLLTGLPPSFTARAIAYLVNEEIELKLQQPISANPQKGGRFEISNFTQFKSLPDWLAPPYR